MDASGNVENSQREYELFKKIDTYLDRSPNEPWGMVSWKFEHKCLITPDQFMKFAQDKLQAGYDCVFINPMIGNEALYLNVWEQGVDCGHNGLDKIALFLQSQLGNSITSLMGRPSFAFCNYFIATPTFWHRYFNFVDHAISMLETEAMRSTEVGQTYAGTAHYARDATVSMKPFVIERLLSSFMMGSSLKHANYQYQDTQYRKKFGDQLGDFLFKLSKIKNEAIESQSNEQLNNYHTIRLNILNTSYKTVIWQLDDPFNYFISVEYRLARL